MFKNFSGKVTSKKEIAPNIIEIKILPNEKIEYLSGQYFSFKIDPKTNRSYSVASPANQQELEFVIDITPGGPGSQFAKNLRIRDEFNLMGPFGFFTLEKTKALDDENTLIFIGVGTGIVPMRSMILDLLKNKKEKNRKIRLYFGLRHNKEAYYFDEFEKLQNENKNFAFHPIISRPDQDWAGSCGHCQDFILKEKILENIKIYICGRNETVKSIADDLINHGYKKENIFYEKFG